MKEEFDDIEIYEEDEITSYKLLFLVAAIEIAILFLVLFINYRLVTTGRMLFYLLLCGQMVLCWSQLPDGKLTRKWQVIMFAIVPYSIFLLIQLLCISNWWGLAFIIIYVIFLTKKYDIDLNDGGSSSGNGTTGKIAGKIIGSTFRDLTKTSKRKRS